jgi:hypothetical protein
MKLKKFALFAEIISAIAIVGSLIFVGIQIQQNSRISQVNAYQELTNQILSINAIHAQNSELAEIQLKARNGIELSENEQFRLQQVMVMVTRHSDLAFLQYQQGYIDQQQLDDVLSPFWINDRLTSVFRPLWERTKGDLNPDFVKYIESSTNWMR